MLKEKGGRRKEEDVNNCDVGKMRDVDEDYERERERKRVRERKRGKEKGKKEGKRDGWREETPDLMEIERGRCSTRDSQKWMEFALMLTERCPHRQTRWNRISGWTWPRNSAACQKAKSE